MVILQFLYWVVIQVFAGVYRPQNAQAAQAQGMVEYALILALVSVAVLAILTLLGPQIVAMFEQIICTMQQTC